MEEVKTQTVEKSRYDNIDGLRAMAAIGVILMHVLSNGNYIIGGGYSNSFIGYIVNHIIGSFGIFVQLFFLISGFAMCCGYYEKIKNNALWLALIFIGAIGLRSSVFAVYGCRETKKSNGFSLKIYITDIFNALNVCCNFAERFAESWSY